MTSLSGASEEVQLYEEAPEDELEEEVAEENLHRGNSMIAGMPLPCSCSEIDLTTEMSEEYCYTTTVTEERGQLVIHRQMRDE